MLYFRHQRQSTNLFRELLPSHYFISELLYNTFMAKYMSGDAALAAWKIEGIEQVLGYKINKDDPVDYTVTTRNERHLVKGQRIHLCTVPLPLGAVRLRNGEPTSSPELLFLEKANEWHILQLIFLGYQLCSHPVGRPKEALTTKEKLTNFVEQTPGYRGRKKALYALKFVIDGSASVMETYNCMKTILPHFLGGYCLKKPVLNSRIAVKKEDRKLLGQNNCYPDMLFIDEKQVVEYQSFEHHNTPSEQSADAEKAEILEKYGYNVKQLFCKQLKSEPLYEIFINNLARLLNMRIRIRTDKFPEMNRFLRDMFE